MIFKKEPTWLHLKSKNHYCTFFSVQWKKKKGCGPFSERATIKLSPKNWSLSRVTNYNKFVQSPILMTYNKSIQALH
jgi:hypothetical protein